MEVKIAHLKNNLSRYLKQVAQTGEPITILDRNRPVAQLVPMQGQDSNSDFEWEQEREQLKVRAKQLGIKMTFSKMNPRSMRELNLSPSIAPDGRTDRETVVEMRKEKDY